MWEAIAFLLAGGAAVWYSALANRKRLWTWQEAAVSCGLQVVEASALLHPWLEARAGRVIVQIGTSGNKGRSIRVSVMAPGSLDFHSVRIRPESLLRWGVREIEIGDESFDKAFFIESPMRLALALLDAETRRLLFRLSTETLLEISSGALQVEGKPDERVLRLLPLLLDLGQRFAQPMDIPQRLAENAHQDPQDGVRLKNLLFLIRQYPKAPQTAEAIRTACSDSSPEIRLRAAKALGAEGRGVLLALAENLENDAVSAEAVTALDQELPCERVRAILDHALGRRRIQTARACVEVLGRSGAADIAGTLVQVMEQETGELAVAAAQALGETGNPAAEPSLIPALRREEQALRVAAANALGRVGSVAAVLPLKEAAELSWIDVDLRRATRQAIAEIQSRIQGASPGQLSLAGAEAGQLSLAQAEAGQLSLSTDSAGQLSLSDESTPEEV